MSRIFRALTPVADHDGIMLKYNSTLFCKMQVFLAEFFAIFQINTGL